MVELTTLGWIHGIFALVSIFSGAYVVLTRKGTRLHRTVGHTYFTGMLATNFTSLFIYELTGTFNFFHASALFSLAVLLIGMVTVIARRPKKSWLRLHAHMISGSYVGLIAALFAEVISRHTALGVATATGVTVAVVSAIGVYFIQTRTETAIARMGSGRSNFAPVRPKVDRIGIQSDVR